MTMKSFAAAICCSLLAMAFSVVRAHADELDDLLTGPPAVETSATSADASGPLPTTASSPIDQLERVDVDYTDHARWQPVVALPSGRDAMVKPARHSEASSAYSVVPEPSAIALALLALVYFLVFGRRRIAA